MLIKEEIKQKQKELGILKIGYKQIVEAIKNSCYDTPFLGDCKKRKPRGEHSVMQAAFHYSKQEAPRLYDTVNLSQGKKYSDNGNMKEYEIQEYWMAYPEHFDRFGSKKPIFILRKKNIKIMKDICKRLWKMAINESFNLRTELGFQEWMDTVDVDDIIELMGTSEFNQKFEIVSNRSLYLKDILIIYPERGY